MSTTKAKPKVTKIPTKFEEKVSETPKKAHIQVGGVVNSASLPSVPASPTWSSASTTKKKETIIAYVHKLSPVKRNKNNTLDYSRLVLQTEQKNMNGLLYSKYKRQILLDGGNAYTPLKIQRFTKSEDDKIIINDMTKISKADQTE